MLLAQLQSLHFLMHQGLAVRGHCNEGNLYQLLKLRSSDIPQLKSWLNHQKYQSPEIVNKQIELMFKNMLRSLLTNIKEQPFYGFIADETRDISRMSCDSISIHSFLVN